MALGVIEDTRGCDGVREGMRGGGVLNAAARVGAEGSDSCRGGWRGTGCLGVPGVSRPVLLNHLSQPFGKVEVSPDGEEALCGGQAEKGVSIPFLRIEFRDTDKNPWPQSSGRGRAPKQFLQLSVMGAEAEAAGAQPVEVQEDFLEEASS